MSTRAYIELISMLMFSPTARQLHW